MFKLSAFNLRALQLAVSALKPAMYSRSTDVLWKSLDRPQSRLGLRKIWEGLGLISECKLEVSFKIRNREF